MLYNSFLNMYIIITFFIAPSIINRSPTGERRLRSISVTVTIRAVLKPAKQELALSLPLASHQSLRILTKRILF